MKYTKTIQANLIKLRQEIEASSFGAKFYNIYTYGDDVILETNEILLPSEEAELDLIYTNHNPIDMEAIIKSKVILSKQLGEDLMADFGTENKMMGLTDTEMLQTSVALRDVQALLDSGSLGLARAEMVALTPIPTILEQTRIDKYVAKIDVMIASL